MKQGAQHSFVSVNPFSAWSKTRRFNRKQWLSFVGWHVFIQACLYYVVASRYLPYIEISQTYAGVYLVSAYVAHFGLAAILIGILAITVAIVLPLRAVIFSFCSIAMLSVLVLLAVDSTVYSLYRFHLNGFIWDLITGPGAQDMFQLSKATVYFIAIACILSVMAVLASLIIAAQLTDSPCLKNKVLIFPVVWLLALLGSQSMHIWYEAHYDTEVTGVTRHLPLYYPATSKRMMHRLGWIDPRSIRSQQLVNTSARQKSLNYPVNTLQCVTPSNAKNVLVIGIDAMRADVFTREIMPNMHALTTHPNAQQFDNHYSGGNVTKSGLFSLFYGLPASYWDGFAAAGVGAEWIKQLQAARYQLGIFTSSTLLSPAFDRTIFSSVPDLRLRSEGDRPSDRDKQSVHDFNEFLIHRDQAMPYFGFLFLDSAHGYDVPAGFKEFEPQWETVDHVKLNNKFDPEPYFNRYKNSLFFLDHQVGQLLEKMEARGDLDNTVVIFTSDHGEEFNDLKQNYWGHGSNFSEFQTKVPLMILWPGKNMQRYDHRTSHFDIAPTVLSEVLGCSNPPEDFSVGNSLFDSATQRDWLLIHSYFNYGLVTDNRIISTYPTGGYEIRDNRYNRITNAKLDNQTVLELLNEVSRFYW